jgi:transcriptional regulator with PAS, ATPase and Fis domain
MATNKNLHITLVEDEPGSEGSARTRPWLICLGSPENDFATAGRIQPIERYTSVLFCRDEEAAPLALREGNEGELEIGIPFGWVSGQHARLELSGIDGIPDVTLTDLGSRNGTLVNGERIRGTVHLRPADVFEVGRSFWMIRHVRIRRLKQQQVAELDPTGTCSPHLYQIQRTLHRLASSSIPIVLRGETGTGKEHLARAVHRLSGRLGPFVLANLGALSADRVESVLFGGPDRSGLFEQANGGTLLLEELGELSPSVQGKLLSALADGRAARVGDEETRTFDVRLICSTMHDLPRMVEDGRFRADLYSRLAGYVAELPPLRARREDIGVLCRSIMTKLAQEGRPVRLTTNAFRRMLIRPWAFNIRQLAQTITTTSLLSSGDGTITAEAIAEVLDQDDGLPQSPDEVRRVRAELVAQLAEHAGDAEAVARALNRDPFQIHRWIQRFDLTPEAFGRGN